MTYPCPHCSVPASPERGCPSCGRGPDLDAIAVVTADAEIADLTARLTIARQAVSQIEVRLGQAWSRRHVAASRVRSRLAPAPVFAPATAVRPEVSNKLMQNVLFMLGGLLLGVAAIVFTAVAWAQFGVGGRALLLAFFTALALAAPLVAVRRGLRATAETFAAVGLLLTLLDGYAAWHVNLFGIADTASGLGFASAVCAVTAAIAAGYEHLTGLTGPRYAALLIAQPVLPLTVATLEPGPTAWALTFAGLAALNLVLFGARRDALGVTSMVLAGLWTLTAAMFGLLTSAGNGLLAMTAVALVAAVAATTLRRRGLWLAAAALIAAPAPTVLITATAAMTGSLRAAQPAFHADLGGLVPGAGGRMPLEVLVLGAAAIVALPARWRRDAALGVAALLALVLPAALHLGWWTAPMLNLLVVAAALFLAARRAAPTVAGHALRAAPQLAAHARDAGPRLAVHVGAVAASPAAASPSAASGVASAAGHAISFTGRGLSFVGQVTTAAFLAAHAVVAGFGRPWIAAAVLTVLAAMGFAVAAKARRAALGGTGLAVGLVALPVITWTVLVALDVDAVWRSRAVLLVTVLLAAVPLLVARHRMFAVAAVALTAAPLPLWAAVTGDPITAYAAAGLLAAATAAMSAATPITAPIAPAAPNAPTEPAAALRRAWPWTGSAALAAVALGFAGGAPWPVVAAGSLLLGLACLLGMALTSPSARAHPLTAAAGLILAIPGFVSLTDTRPATLAALAAVLIAAAVSGATGRTAAARLTGWPVAAASAAAMAVTVGDLAGFDPLGTAFLVLGAAALAAAVAWVPLAARPAEARVAEAAAHATALTALLLASGAAGHAAAVCTLWGLVLGVRAFQPAGWRWYVVAAAVTELAAWFLLLSTADVTLLEAYTIPASGVALLAGVMARRARPGLSSWAAYGPALAASMMPSLASVLGGGGDGQPVRRLLLGLAALAVVVAGSHARLRAPVLVGGGVLVVLALHELVRVWDLIPRWIPLAAGGLLLVALAMTLERRRRDLDRFRSAIHRMS